MRGEAEPDSAEEWGVEYVPDVRIVPADGTAVDQKVSPGLAELKGAMQIALGQPAVPR